MTRALALRCLRLIHLYTSAVLLASLAFFAVTGVALNHGWYGQDAAAESWSLPLDEPLQAALGLPSQWSPDLTRLQAEISRRTTLGTPQRIEQFEDFEEISLEYDLIAGQALVLVTPAELSIEIDRGSWLAVLNALHKGRGSGGVWSAFIDVSAIGMLVFALTGFGIVLFNRQRRRQALVTLAAGVLTPVLLYGVLTPGAGPQRSPDGVRAVAVELSGLAARASEVQAEVD
ncbi:MAG: PepSY-associated TM helix domain-containing protein [Pseudomonadota bacterium]